MIPELGNFAIIIALCFAFLQGIATFLFRKSYRGQTPAKTSLRPIGTLVISQFIFLAFAMLCLIISFVTNDLSVAYVQEHSHNLLPFIYRVGAAWGGHEGSLLLWCLILSFWSVALLTIGSTKIYYPKLIQEKFTEILPTMLSVLGFLSLGFIAFLFFTSNPFQRIFPTQPIVGNDLTPVLQDPGLIFHPPMLYLGYVGFAIAFAFAITILIKGRLEKTWARALRPWIILPWSFLSCGIVLGSWWAYRELGWGGWWFWDPVENASLLPWLAATALLHSLIVSEKRDTFQGWTILLAIVTFTLSLLGTFLVRSGVLVSVHTFANDPTRGLFLLAYLAIIIGGAFTFYVARIKTFYREPNFHIFSRESFLLVNSVILLTAVVTISLGTLYPIILDALGLEKISVGEPYFNTIFLPLMLPMLLLMAMAPHIHWGKQDFYILWKKIHLSFFASLLIGFLFPLILGLHFYLLTSLAVSFASWIILSTLQYTFRILKIQKKMLWQNWAMIVAHIGIAVFTLGVTLNKTYSSERQVKITVGETVSLAGYNFDFQSVDKVAGVNYQSISANFLVGKPNHLPQILTAQQRIYDSHNQDLSKPGILTNPFRDLYLALGNSFSQNTWSVRIYYKPFVRWIWFGGLLLLLGGLMSLLDPFRKETV